MLPSVLLPESHVFDESAVVLLISPVGLLLPTSTHAEHCALGLGWKLHLFCSISMVPCLFAST